MVNSYGEDEFWKTPDEWFAIIILNENKEKVNGIVKGNLALLDGIPNPITGFFYKDIIKVEGPTGNKWQVRDNQVNEYKVIEVHQKSKYLTFTFEALIPQPSGYFNLMEVFEKENLSAEFPWPNFDNNVEWREGYCAAESFEIAQNILNSFLEKKPNCQLRNLKRCG